MKKIICFTLLTCFCFLFACTHKTDLSKEEYLGLAQKLGYFSVDNLTWGMSKEMCFDTMKKKETDFKKEVLADEYGYKVKSYYYTGECKVFDTDATLLLYFGENADKKNQLGLYEIRIQFKNEVSLSTLEQKIKKHIEENNLSYSRSDGSSIIYQNKKLIKDTADEQLKSKTIDIATSTYNLPKGENSELDGIGIGLNVNDIGLVSSVKLNGIGAAVLCQAYRE